MKTANQRPFYPFQAKESHNRKVNGKLFYKKNNKAACLHTVRSEASHYRIALSDLFWTRPHYYRRVKIINMTLWRGVLLQTML